MYLSFRQGLVAYQKANGIQYAFAASTAVADCIDIVVAPTPFIATIAHGASNYLVQFDTTRVAAWGPISGPATVYFYFCIDILTGQPVFKTTTLEPIISHDEPLVASAGQLWFDLTACVLKTRTSDVAGWFISPGVIVGRVINGNLNQIVAMPFGSGVGIFNVSASSGHILLDTQLRPLRTSDGELLTSDSPIRIKNSASTSGVLSSPAAGAVVVKAAELIPPMGLVYFSGPDTVALANSDPSIIPPQTPVGLIQTGVGPNDTAVVTLFGEVVYQGWDWGNAVGAPLYCSGNGEITLTRPVGLQTSRVGYVKNAKTIIFAVDTETTPQVYAASGSIIQGIPPVISTSVVNSSGEVITSISIPPATNSQNGYMLQTHVATLESFDSRITTTENSVTNLSVTKAATVHTHAIGDITGLDTELNNKSNTNHTHIGYAPTVHTHTEYATLAHNHEIYNVSGLQAALDSKAVTIHTHTIVDVTGLQDVLDSKAFTNHTHTIANVSGLQAALDSKAPEGHSHAVLITDIVGLQDALDTKSAVGHGHSIPAISGLEDALTGKAAAVHTHAISEVVNLQSTLDAKALSVHTHAISEVVGLQADLDAKALAADLSALQTVVSGKSSIGHAHVAADISDFAAASYDVMALDILEGTNITIVKDSNAKTITINTDGVATWPIVSPEGATIESGLAGELLLKSATGGSASLIVGNPVEEQSLSLTATGEFKINGAAGLVNQLFVSGGAGAEVSWKSISAVLPALTFTGGAQYPSTQAPTTTSTIAVGEGLSLASTYDSNLDIETTTLSLNRVPRLQAFSVSGSSDFGLSTTQWTLQSTLGAAPGNWISFDDINDEVLIVPAGNFKVKIIVFAAPPNGSVVGGTVLEDPVKVINYQFGSTLTQLTNLTPFGAVRMWHQSFMNLSAGDDYHKTSWEDTFIVSSTGNAKFSLSTLLASDDAPVWSIQYQVTIFVEQL